jgi:hypothetical protein
MYQAIWFTVTVGFKVDILQEQPLTPHVQAFKQPPGMLILWTAHGYYTPYS